MNLLFLLISDGFLQKKKEIAAKYKMAAPPPEEENKSANRMNRVNDLLRVEALRSGVKMAEGLAVLISAPVQIAGIFMGVLKNSVDLLSTVVMDSMGRRIKSIDQNGISDEQNKNVQQRKSLLRNIEKTTDETLVQMGAALQRYINAQNLFLSICIGILKKRDCRKSRGYFFTTNYDCDGTKTGQLIQELNILTEKANASVSNLQSFQHMIPASLSNKSVETSTPLDVLVDGSNEQLHHIIEKAQAVSDRIFDSFAQFGEKLQLELDKATEKQSAASNPMLLSEPDHVDDVPLDSRAMVPFGSGEPTLALGSGEVRDIVPYVDPDGDSERAPDGYDEPPRNPIKEIDGGRRTKKRSLRKSKKTRLGRRSRQNRRRTRTAI